MDGFWWILPALGCGLMMVMMVVMMLGMGKDMFSRSKGDANKSVEELRAEHERLSEDIKRLEDQDERRSQERERSNAPV
jgi:hypothetical protein